MKSRHLERTKLQGNAGAQAELRTRALKNMFIFRVSENAHIVKTKFISLLCGPKYMLPIFKHLYLMYEKMILR